MEWLLGDWRGLLPGAWAYAALVLVAIAAGSIVGLERERKDKPAGMLTLVLVCLGAAVFTMVSDVFNGPEGDPSRVAAQVVTGVGFLGAGVILRGNGAITGTVTAATIWAMAAVGMVVGVGYAGPALGLSALLLGVLMIVSWLQRRFIDAWGHTTLHLVFDPDGGKTIFKIEEVLHEHELNIQTDEIRSRPDGLVEARLTYRYAHRQDREFLGRLARLPEIKQIRREDSGGKTGSPSSS